MSLATQNVQRPMMLGSCETRAVGKRVWEVVRTFTYLSAVKKLDLIIPARFLTDGASAPRLVWWLFPPMDGVYDDAVVIHDFVVRYRKILGISLRDCHLIFLECLEYLGVTPRRRRTMYGTVYAFNWMIAGKGDGTPPRRLIRAAKRRTQ